MELRPLTPEQRECLSAHYLMPDRYLLAKEMEFYLKIVNRETGIPMMVDKFTRRKEMKR